MEINKEKVSQLVVFSESWAEISQDCGLCEGAHHNRTRHSVRTLTPWQGSKEERKRRRERKKYELPGPPTFLRGTALRT